MVPTTIKGLGTAAWISLVHDYDVLPVPAIKKDPKDWPTSSIHRTVLERPADLFKAPFSLEYILRHVH